MKSLQSSLRTGFLAVPAAALILCCGTAVQAADSWDPLTDRLTIPFATVGGATFTNLVVTISAIDSGPLGSGPDSYGDSYDPATRQLTVPAVVDGARTFFNCVGTVDRLVSAGSVTGADTYDGGVLTLASVRVADGTVYSNVRVTITHILGVAAGMPAAIEDTYDGTTLRVAAVSAGGEVYTNVSVTVGTVLSVGGGPALTILPAQVVSGLIDQAGGARSSLAPTLLVATGGNVGVAGYTWSLPPGAKVPFPGMVIEPNGVVGDPSPGALMAGVYTLPVQVSDGTTTRSGSVTVELTSSCDSGGGASNPCVSSFPTNQHVPYLPAGVVGVPYAATLSTSGGTPPYRWTRFSGTLPPGLAIDAAQGVLRGIPTQPGSYTFFVLTTDAAQQSTLDEDLQAIGYASFTLTIN